jgi:hypothetical protein
MVAAFGGAGLYFGTEGSQSCAPESAIAMTTA